MTLSNGTKLSHYEISSQLGKGGMGEVYRAKDQKLGRDVAIKVLPEEFAKDADRVARFQREAKLLASLNHPNIASIYGLEESDGTHFLVLELIEGDTLADRLKRGAIPVEDSLKLALQIAEALEAAHEKGVIHRDLKPANIKVTPDGKVKVLDFGLAKAFAGEQADLNLSQSPTLSAAATQQGIILGTAAYMSPEQASGETVDKRADIWAFGIVLYEILTGRSLFEGNNVSQTLARVLEREPDFSALPPNLHFRIRLLLERCLKKEPKNRCSGISDARVDIQEVLSDPNGVFVQPGAMTKPRKRIRVGLPWVVAIATLCIIIALVIGWNLKPSNARQVTRFYFELTEDQQFEDLVSRSFAISPDGSQIVYKTNRGLYLRPLAELDARLILGTEEMPQKPFFSPDGQWIGYISGTQGKLKKISINGGAPVSLADITSMGALDWGIDATIVYCMGESIMTVSADGGNPEALVEEIGEGCYTPQILPDGKTVMYTVGAPPFKTMLQSLASGDRRELFTGDSARYLPTGHIVYAVNNDLFARPFDIHRLEATGGAVAVLEGVLRSGGAPHFAVSDSGTLVYVPGVASRGAGTPQRTLVWVDKYGKEKPIPIAINGTYSPRISPDGTRLALSFEKDGNVDIYNWDLARKTMTRLTFSEGEDRWPLWTPDGKRIVFSSAREGALGDIYSKLADGSGEVQKLASWPNISAPFAWSRDGETLLSWDLALDPPQTSIAMLQSEGDNARRPLLQGKFNYDHPQVSPDGRWLAYATNESGRSEVFVCSYPEVQGKWQISSDGGYGPLWSPDGRELFYRNGESVIAVSVETEPVFKPGKSEVLFSGTYAFSTTAKALLPAWDIHPDGKRFLMMKDSMDDTSTKEASRPKINIVLNWFEELKERVPTD